MQYRISGFFHIPLLKADVRSFAESVPFPHFQFLQFILQLLIHPQTFSGLIRIPVCNHGANGCKVMVSATQDPHLQKIQPAQQTVSDQFIKCRFCTSGKLLFQRGIRICDLFDLRQQTFGFIIRYRMIDIISHMLRPAVMDHSLCAEYNIRQFLLLFFIKYMSELLLRPHTQVLCCRLRSAFTPFIIVISQI